MRALDIPFIDVFAPESAWGENAVHAAYFEAGGFGKGNSEAVTTQGFITQEIEVKDGAEPSTNFRPLAARRSRGAQGRCANRNASRAVDGKPIVLATGIPAPEEVLLLLYWAPWNRLSRSELRTYESNHRPQNLARAITGLIRTKDMVESLMQEAGLGQVSKSTASRIYSELRARSSRGGRRWRRTRWRPSAPPNREPAKLPFAVSARVAFNIDPLDDRTIEAAGALVAREHTVARDLYPALPAAFGDPDTCTLALQHLRDNGYTGAVAVDRGRTVGVMTLAAMTGLVYGAYARLAPDGFAVAPDLDDPTTVLARLYSELAPRFLAGGMLQYFLDHVSLAPLSESLANLGFARHHVYASQAAAARSHSTNVRIRVGGSADLDSIARLAQVEIEHRATPPIYAPPDARSLDSITDMHRGLLERGAVHFIAALDRRDVGLLTVELTSPAPRLCANGQPYIGPTATHPDARGRGVGRALVDAALSWADDHGYHWVSVDFEPANPLSRPFWMGNGFQPIGYGVLRSIHPAHLPNRG